MICDTAEITLNDLEAGRDQLDKVKDNFKEAHQAWWISRNRIGKGRLIPMVWRQRPWIYRAQNENLRTYSVQSLQRALYAESSSSVVKSRRSGTWKSSSHKSSLRSVSLARADAAAKVAKAKIEMKFLERETELELIRLEKQYALAKAEEDAFKEILDEESKPVVQIKGKPH